MGSVSSREPVLNNDRAQESDQFFPYFNVRYNSEQVQSQRKRLINHQNKYSHYLVVCEKVAGAPPNDTHTVMVWGLFQDYLMPYQAKTWFNVNNAAKCKYFELIYENMDVAGIIFFDDVVATQDVAGTNMRNLFTWCTMNSVKLKSDFVATSSKNDFANGDLSVMFSACPTIASNHYGFMYDNFHYYAEQYLKDHHLVDLSATNDLIVDAPESEGDGWVNPSSSPYDPVTAGFQPVAGWKSVQINNVFYNIPQRLNVAITLTNQLWRDYMGGIASVRYLVLYWQPISLMPYFGAQSVGSVVGWTGLDLVFYYLIDEIDRIQYLEEQKISENSDMIDSYKMVDFVENRVKSMKLEPYSNNAIKGLVKWWPTDLNPNEMDYLLQKSEFIEFLDNRIMNYINSKKKK